MSSIDIYDGDPSEAYSDLGENVELFERRPRGSYRFDSRQRKRMLATGFANPPRPSRKRAPRPLRPIYNTDHLLQILDHTDDTAIDPDVIARTEHSHTQVMDLLQDIGETAMSAVALEEAKKAHFDMIMRTGLRLPPSFDA